MSNAMALLDLRSFTRIIVTDEKALALYDGLGFATVADTLMLHRRM